MKINQDISFCREEEGRKRVRLIQRQLVEVRKEKETELQQRNEMIAHLKDQLQEMKAKTNMEGKYIKKRAEVSVAQTSKRCNMEEKEMREEIEVDGSYHIVYRDEGFEIDESESENAYIGRFSLSKLSLKHGLSCV